MHMTAARNAATKLTMPAMSPTMTEGGIASWKKKEGEAFASGDVLLEIETDKATIDVEAQDDGVLGKILAPDGTKNILVGKTIAILAEEGDDLSSLEIPADEPAPQASTPAPQPSISASSGAQAKQAPTPPSHSHVEVPKTDRPLFPSVLRLIQEHGIAQAEFDKIKGTGVRGMLTKGDVLAHLGLASTPTGTFRETTVPDVKTAAKSSPKAAPPPLDGAALRRLIVGNMLEASVKARATAAPSPPADFDSVIADYLPELKPRPSFPSLETATTKPKSADFLDGLI
ncbi:single hybrid motif-containing protein [Epithele typhae]|uniref:single hybrid motif-containing protein n=1 Tax=Epithele typhae TaxID=378194 RepID=UPI0020080249|nr:single hybrid motif-containing protein [Epithele typhae]KAH9915784.1 single hybrid motif-containing protein [Epithele typhae]